MKIVKAPLVESEGSAGLFSQKDVELLKKDFEKEISLVGSRGFGHHQLLLNYAVSMKTLGIFEDKQLTPVLGDLEKSHELLSGELPIGSALSFASDSSTLNLAFAKKYPKKFVEKVVDGLPTNPTELPSYLLKMKNSVGLDSSYMFQSKEAIQSTYDNLGFLADDDAYRVSFFIRDSQKLGLDFILHPRFARQLPKDLKSLKQNDIKRPFAELAAVMVDLGLLTVPKNEKECLPPLRDFK